MAWRALNVGEDGTVFTEDQGPMSPMMALIMGRAQALMAQREQEDADELQQKKELTSETQKEVDKEVKDVKDGEKVGQEIEDGMGGKSSCPATSSSLTDIPQQKKKAPKKKKGKKWEFVQRFVTFVHFGVSTYRPIFQHENTYLEGKIVLKSCPIFLCAFQFPSNTWRTVMAN